MAAGPERTHAEERSATPAAPASRAVRRKASAEQPILELQRAVGNQATADLLEDERERESSTSPGAEPPPVVYDVLSRPGAPLDASVRAVMESRFSSDFGAVRIHNDARAQQSAAAVGARAYTVGRDVVFGAPGFNANDPGSVSTLAHELTHTVQNRGFAWQGERLELDSPDTEEEREAAGAGATVQREVDDAGSVGVGGALEPVLRRQPAASSSGAATPTKENAGIDAAARAAADVLQHGRLQLLGDVAPSHRAALVELQAAVTGKRGSSTLNGDERLALMDRSRAHLRSIFLALAHDRERKAWVEREVNPYLDRLSEAIQLQIARERVGRAELVGEKVIDPAAPEGAREAKEALRMGAGKMIETLKLLNEQVIRFRHDELHEAAHELLELSKELAKEEKVHGVHKLPSDPGSYIVDVQNVLVLLHGLLSLSDEELAHELNKPHGALGVVASVTELVRISTEIIGGTLAATFSFAGVVAKYSKGQEAFAAQAMGTARVIGLQLGNIIAGIEIAHGLVVLFDSHASAEKRDEALRDVASGTAWFIGSKIGGGVVGGAASTSVLITYQELKLMAQLYGEARTGIVGGQMNLAFEAMAEAGRTIVEDGTALTKAGYLAAAEKDPAQHKALANVEQQNAIKLAASVDAFLERCRPTAYGAGAAYRPGAYAVLRPVFAPLLRRVGASTPSAAATAATDVLAAIRWCFEHAQELQLKEAGYEPQPAEHRREGGSEHE